MVVDAVAVLLEIFGIPVVFVGGMLGQECVIVTNGSPIFGRFFTAF